MESSDTQKFLSWISLKPKSKESKSAAQRAEKLKQIEQLKERQQFERDFDYLEG